MTYAERVVAAHKFGLVFDRFHVEPVKEDK